MWVNVLTETETALEQEQPQAPVYSGGCLSEKQLGRRRPRGPGGHKVDCEPAMCPCGKEWCPGLR